jgi:uncharacterized protein YbaR (Trm112 family)
MHKKQMLTVVVAPALSVHGRSLASLIVIVLATLACPWCAQQLAVMAQRTKTKLILIVVAHSVTAAQLAKHARSTKIVLATFAATPSALILLFLRQHLKELQLVALLNLTVLHLNPSRSLNPNLNLMGPLALPKMDKLPAASLLLSMLLLH